MMHSAANPSTSLTLVIRRTIKASPQQIFHAWTSPDALKKWWGPKNVRCPHAEVDLRVGGKYRIANELPDGKVLWIEGEFQSIEPPEKLVYTWQTDPQAKHLELVTVLFKDQLNETEIVITHQRIDSQSKHDNHQHGWVGCLQGLEDLLTAA